MKRLRVKKYLFPALMLLSSMVCFALPSGSLTSNSGTWRPHTDWDFDGKRILGHIGNDIFVWDAATGKVLQKLKGHESALATLQFTPDGNHILSSSGMPFQGGDFSPCEEPLLSKAPKDVSTRLWYLKTGKEVWKLNLHLIARLSGDGAHLLAFALDRNCSLNSRLVMLDASTGKVLFTVAPHDFEHLDPIYDSTSMSPDSRTGYCMTLQSTMSFDLATGRVLFIKKTGPGQFGPYSIADGGLFTWIDDHKLVTWTHDGTASRNTRIDGTWQVFAPYLGWMEGNHYLVAAQPERSGNSGPNVSSLIRVVNAGSGETVSRLRLDVGVGEVLVNPNGKSALIWAGQDGINTPHNPLRFVMYDLARNKILWEGGSDAFQALGFSPDGKTILFGGGPIFEVRDATSGKVLSSLDLLGDKMGYGFGS